MAMVAVSCCRNCRSDSPKRPWVSSVMGVTGWGWYLFRLWSSARLLAWLGVLVAFVVPAKAEVVVAEVTITSRCMVESAV